MEVVKNITACKVQASVFFSIWGYILETIRESVELREDAPSFPFLERLDPIFANCSFPFPQFLPSWLMGTDIRLS